MSKLEYKRGMRLSLVIPAYNEAAKIREDLKAAKQFLEAQPFRSEVLVINDGSSDETESVVRQFLAQQHLGSPDFRLLSYPENRGKGFAIRYGVFEATGEMIAFADSGSCVPLSYLLDGMKKIEAGADYAIASRRHPTSRIHRQQPKYRQIGSKVFHFIVHKLMGIQFVSDTQCGFKVYKGSVAKEVFGRTKTDGFMFDIEALLLAQRLGYRVEEFPIEWQNDGDTRYHPIWGTLRNFSELVRIRLRLLRSTPA